MRRRALLRAGGVAAALASVPAGAAARTRRRAAPTQNAYEPLGRIPIDDAAEAVVGDDGETVYVAATTGFATVDISDPAAPELLAEERGIEFDGAGLSHILDATVDGDRLVVAGPGNRAGDELFYGFARYDVSDPAAPELLGEPYETGYHIHNCYLEDDVLYVVRNGPSEATLELFDVGGDEAERIGRWSLLEHDPGWADVDSLVRYLHDVYVQDDVAYLPFWDAGTYLLDVSDPAEPEYVSRVAETTLEDVTDRIDEYGREDVQFGLPGNDHYSAVDDAGDLLAVGREAWATGRSDPDRPGGIDLYDVSDPAEPVHRATIEAPRAVNERYYGGFWTTAHNFELRDGELYSAWYQGGVKIHDVSDPADPEELAWWRDPADAGFWTARVADPGETFVASSTTLIPRGPTEGALYTFPIEAGEQADPPSLTDPDDLEFDVEPPDESDTGGNATDESQLEDADEAVDESADANSNSTSNSNSSGPDSIPGFTVGAAGTGLGVAGGAAALAALRRRFGVEADGGDTDTDIDAEADANADAGDGDDLE